MKGNEVQKIEKDRMVPSGQVEEGSESCNVVQIFVTVDGAGTSTMEMAMSDKVDDSVKRFPIGDEDQDVNVTSGGRILRGSEKLRSCGVRDGSTVQVTSRAGKKEDTRTRGASLRRNKPRTQKDQSRRATKNQGAAKVQ